MNMLFRFAQERVPARQSRFVCINFADADLQLKNCVLTISQQLETCQI